MISPQEGTTTMITWPIRDW